MLHAQIKLWRQQKVRRSSDIWIKKQKVTSEEDNPVKAPGNNTFWCLSKRSQQIWNKQKITTIVDSCFFDGHHQCNILSRQCSGYLAPGVPHPLPLVLGKFPEMSSCWHLITCIAAKLTGCKKQLILLKISKTVLECQTFHQPMKMFLVARFSFLEVADQRPAREIYRLTSYNSQFSTNIALLAVRDLFCNEKPLSFVDI